MTLARPRCAWENGRFWTGTKLTGWTGNASADAFLALDRNGNGLINSGRELFGDVTLLDDGSASASGYVALAELDRQSNGGNGNGNGFVDRRDRGFAALLLWKYSDHDRRSSLS
jgi:hypothetical protein